MRKLQLCKCGQARRRLLWGLSDVDALQILHELRCRKRAHAELQSRCKQMPSNVVSELSVVAQAFDAQHETVK